MLDGLTVPPTTHQDRAPVVTHFGIRGATFGQRFKFGNRAVEIVDRPEQRRESRAGIVVFRSEVDNASHVARRFARASRLLGQVGKLFVGSSQLAVQRGSITQVAFGEGGFAAGP